MLHNKIVIFNFVYILYYLKIQKEKNNVLKPVMFWIHGGGFFSGSGNTEIYGPEYLVANDIVLVTINYRLGVLGEI